MNQILYSFIKRERGFVSSNPSSTILLFGDQRGLYVKADSTYDCAQNMFCTAKLSMSHCFTKGVSGDVWYL